MPLPPPSAAANRVTASSVNERCSGSCLGRQRETTESRGIEHRVPPDRQARTYRTVITRWRKPDSFSASELKLSMSVNVSVSQLSRPGFGADVTAALQAEGFPPEALCLEVTESMLTDI